MPSSKPTTTSTLIVSHKTVLPVALTQAQVRLLAVMPLQAVVKVQVLASPRVLVVAKATLIATLPLMQTAKLTLVAPPPLTLAMTSTLKAVSLIRIEHKA